MALLVRIHIEGVSLDPEIGQLLIGFAKHCLVCCSSKSGPVDWFAFKYSSMYVEGP